VSDRDIPLALGIGAQELIIEDEAVVGAIVADDAIRARKVLLATNGFAANRELVAKWCPEIAGVDYFGALGSTGEAVIWGEKIGTSLGNMGAYQGYAAVAYPHGSLLTWTTIEKGGILVGVDGRRFGNEDAGYSGYTPHVMAQGEFAFALYDQRIHDIALAEEEYAELVAVGGVHWAEDGVGLAPKYGLDSSALTATIEAYNAGARGAKVDKFGRANFGLAPLEPPFALVRVKPGLFHTQGGLIVDCHARVMHANGRVVKNLFAGGGAAAGISGRAGAGGYASGNGLLTALGLGRIAGVTAAAEINGGS
jgi:succinate dehydrogenase/fumarate reductase flavoprotein subunit